MEVVEAAAEAAIRNGLPRDLLDFDTNYSGFLPQITVDFATNYTNLHELRLLTIRLLGTRHCHVFAALRYGNSSLSTTGTQYADSQIEFFKAFSVIRGQNNTISAN